MLTRKPFAFSKSSRDAQAQHRAKIRTAGIAAGDLRQALFEVGEFRPLIDKLDKIIEKIEARELALR